MQIPRADPIGPRDDIKQKHFFSILLGVRGRLEIGDLRFERMRCAAALIEGHPAKRQHSVNREVAGKPMAALGQSAGGTSGRSICERDIPGL
jgi:hypothetical protein